MLNELLYRVNIKAVSGNLETTISNLQTDSRKVTPGTCFIAVKGVFSDGHQFIPNAILQGAKVIICEQLPQSLKEDVCYVEVADTSVAAGIISANYFGNPSEKMKVVGVTGTNGKTTIATLLWKLFTELGYTCGLVSTVQNRIGSRTLESTHTTPDPVSLQALMAEMRNEGCTHVFMECSSHAIHQQRIAGVHFTGAIFSNITHDHLDYHGSFEEYIRVKKSWFDGLPSHSFAISNSDDKRGHVMLQNTKAKKLFYSLRTLADFKGKILDNSLNGLHLILNDIEVHFRMIGNFNAYNLLAVFGAAVSLGEDKHNVLQVMSSLTGAEGRFDFITSKNEKVVGIVDYAHTPDALLNVLATIKDLRQENQKIVTVVGCGGNRDKQKRPIMAEVACQHSDKIILTSDNPRDEDPQDILRDMESGINVVCRKKCITIADRREAIKTAVNLTSEKDILLIAGKGHEKYQEIRGVRHPFDDKEVMNEMFELLEK